MFPFLTAAISLVTVLQRKQNWAFGTRSMCTEDNRTAHNYYTTENKYLSIICILYTVVVWEYYHWLKALKHTEMLAVYCWQLVHNCVNTLTYRRVS